MLQPKIIRVILHQLLTGYVVTNTVSSLQRERPSVPSTRLPEELRRIDVMKDLASAGFHQMNHVWSLKMHTLAAKQRLVDAKELTIKSGRCLFIDPENMAVKVKLHWVPYDVPNGQVKKELERYGKVSEITRELFREKGFKAVESNTRSARLTLKKGYTVDSLPHKIRLEGCKVLVVVPGRAPLCLRCRRTGHIRRDCRIPRCSDCHRFGHEADDCVKTYASTAGHRRVDDQLDFGMDDAEAEEAVGASGLTVHPPSDGGGSATPEDVDYPAASSHTGWKQQLRACAARREGDGGEDGGATGSRAKTTAKATELPREKVTTDSRLREAGAEVVYCLTRGAPKGPNLPRARLNHQDALFLGHGLATHSQTWVPPAGPVPNADVEMVQVIKRLRDPTSTPEDAAAGRIATHPEAGAFGKRTRVQAKPRVPTEDRRRKNSQTPVYEKRGPKWCIASPGGPRRVQTYPGLGSTTRMPFSSDTGSPRTARRGCPLRGSGSVETPLSKHLLAQVPPAGPVPNADVEMVQVIKRLRDPTSTPEDAAAGRIATHPEAGAFGKRTRVQAKPRVPTEDRRRKNSQ
ncbi:hypothetical protein ISCGN_026899 [Ixodes scapularis]